MQINLNVEVRTEELVNGKTVLDLLAAAFGLPALPDNSPVAFTIKEPAPADRLAQHQAERDAHLAEDSNGDEGMAFVPPAATTAPQPAAPPQTPAAAPPQTPAAAPPPAAPGGLDVAAVSAAGIKVDSEGVPYDNSIHNSNKRFYDSGSNKGRWMWKRGIDKDEAETKAQQLAHELRQRFPAGGAQPAAQPAAQAPAATAPGPVAEGNGSAPPAQAPGPVAENHAPAQDADGKGPWVFAKLMKALDDANIGFDTALTTAQKYGVDSIQKLSLTEHQGSIAAIAAELGLQKPW